MAEWVYAQKDPAEELAQLHYFSFKKRQADGEIEFVITVKAALELSTDPAPLLTITE